MQEALSAANSQPQPPGQQRHFGGQQSALPLLRSFLDDFWGCAGPRWAVASLLLSGLRLSTENKLNLH